MNWDILGLDKRKCVDVRIFYNLLEGNKGQRKKKFVFNKFYDKIELRIRKKRMN
jgi:hypothetical protein